MTTAVHRNKNEHEKRKKANKKKKKKKEENRLWTLQPILEGPKPAIRSATSSP